MMHANVLMFFFKCHGSQSNGKQLRGYQKFPNIQHGDAMETTAVAGMVSEAKLILQGWKMKVNRKKPVEVS